MKAVVINNRTGQMLFFGQDMRKALEMAEKLNHFSTGWHAIWFTES